MALKSLLNITPLLSAALRVAGLVHRPSRAFGHNRLPSLAEPLGTVSTLFPPNNVVAFIAELLAFGAFPSKSSLLRHTHVAGLRIVIGPLNPTAAVMSSNRRTHSIVR